MAGDGLVVSQPEECAIFIFHITRDATDEQPEGQWSTVCFYHFVPNDFAGSLD